MEFQNPHGKQTNRIPFSSSCPLESIASNIRQYMTFAVLLTGNPVNALGNGIQGGSGVSIVINSKFIRCVPPFSLLVWINNGGSQSQPPGSSACTHAGISGIIRCKWHAPGHWGKKKAHASSFCSFSAYCASSRFSVWFRGDFRQNYSHRAA